MEKNQNILIIGGTGFTGKRVLQKLSETDHQITCMLRKGSHPPEWDGKHPLNVVRGDLDSIDDITKALAGKDGLIYVASLGFGHAPNVIEALKNANVSRAVFTSTTAILTKLNAQSKTARQAAEKAINESGLNFTIIRPTMIFGRKGDRNMERLVKYLKRFPVLFIPGDGNAKQQPNFVDDVASALVQAYFEPKSIGKTYNISGKEPLTFNDVVRITSAQLGKKVMIVHLPLMPCRLLLRGLEKVIKNPKLKEEQLLRLNEDKSFRHDDAAADFNYSPIDFETGITNLIEELSA